MNDFRLRQDVLDELEHVPAKWPRFAAVTSSGVVITLTGHVPTAAIRVSIRDGDTVLPEGHVGNWKERVAAENAAWPALGVKSVESHLYFA